MIEMKNLTLGYKKEKILKNLNLKIKKGEFVGIIGPSGAGKSTLLMSVLGGIKVFDGHFSVLKYNMNKLKKKELNALRKEVGVIFQGYCLVDRLSVLDNVISGILKDMPMPRAIIRYYQHKELKLAKRFMKIVDIEKYSLKRCDELSGGQRQRVAIARALMGNPKVILADEPISALDVKSATKVMEILKKVNEEYGVSIITNLHHLEYAKEYCTRILGVNGGRVVFDGSPKELNEKMIERIYQDSHKQEVLESHTTQSHTAQGHTTESHKDLSDSQELDSHSLESNALESHSNALNPTSQKDKAKKDKESKEAKGKKDSKDSKDKDSKGRDSKNP